VKHIAAIYNCYSEVVHWQATFLLLLHMLEAQRRYHTLLNMNQLIHCLKFC